MVPGMGRSRACRDKPARVAATDRSWSFPDVCLRTLDVRRAQPGTSEDELDRLVAARLSRQAIFGKPEPPYCVVVIDESALRRRIGTPQVMHDQLTHLAEMAAQPYVTLQVVPCGPNAGLSGGFMIASADGASDVVVAESLEDVTLGARAFARKAAVVFDIVRGEALTVAQSLSLIMEVAGHWKSQV